MFPIFPIDSYDPLLAYLSWLASNDVYNLGPFKGYIKIRHFKYNYKIESISTSLTPTAKGNCS